MSGISFMFALYTGLMGPYVLSNSFIAFCVHGTIVPKMWARSPENGTMAHPCKQARCCVFKI